MRSSCLLLSLCAVLACPSFAEEAKPGLIEVEAQFVEFDMPDIEALSVQGMITMDGLLALRKQGKSRLLAAPKIVAKSGQEATVKAVTEVIYPCEFRVQAERQDEPTAVPNAPAGADDAAAPATHAPAAKAPASPAQPADFVSREVGVLLSVVPDVAPEGGLINLTLTPELVCEPTWKDYGSTFTNKAGKAQIVKMEAPFFHTYTATSQIGIKSGATALLGGGMNSRDGKKVVYVFVRARLVEAEGKTTKEKTGRGE